MKRIIGLLLACVLVLGLAGCGGDGNGSGGADDANTPAETNTPDDASTPDDTGTPDDANTPDDTASGKSEGVMTYAEYAEAAVDTQVVVETYVQAKQSWWDGKGTFYTQDHDGAYFLYNMP